MSDRVTCHLEGGVADVRLNRPDKLNALDVATFRALVETGEALKAEPGVRAVVLSGEGRAFSAGLDFAAFQAMAGDAPSLRDDVDGRHDAGDTGTVDLGRPAGRITNLAQQACYVWTELPVPVIAAIHGHCLGGGLQIALGTDIRIVAPDTKLSVLEVRWGLIPDMTGTQVLPGLVGRDVAKELTFTGRTVSGSEAVALGLATRVSDKPLEDARALAGEIAAKSPHAIRGAKALLEMAGRVSLAEGFQAEERTIRTLIGSPNQVEAIMAYFEKREPTFAD
jgi:enoyl-CoA hydratase/carnithine racemase